jgi:hypothetical protein
MQNIQEGIPLGLAVHKECADFVRANSAIKSVSGGRFGFLYDGVQFCRPDGSVQAEWSIHNLMPDAALRQIQTSAHEGAAQVVNFYIGVYANNRTPLSTDTAANIPDYGEITSFEEGSRQLWNKGTLQGTMYDSADNPAILTATATITIQGVLMSTASAFDSTSGFLWSAALAPSPQTLDVGGMVRIPAAIALVNA